MHYLNLISTTQLTEHPSTDCEFRLSEKDLPLV